MSVNRSGEYPRLRAPTDDGEILCTPPWSQAAQLVADNRAQLADQDRELLGRSHRELAEQARTALLTSARKYTSSYTDIETKNDPRQPFVLTGHQPGFVHPGVWLKNFAAAQLAEDVEGIAISLVIDSDLCRENTIRVPTGSVEQPRVEHVAYDQSFDQVPYEERRIVAPDTWQSFGKRTSETLAPLVDNPTIKQWWPKELASSQTPKMLTPALAQTRHRLELEWHSKSLEIPQSYVCQTAPFRWFAAALLAEAERFRSAYNEALADYRQAHQLRNHAQPVPDLQCEGGWIETPFWIWSTDEPQRRPLFVKPEANQLLLNDRANWTGTLPLPAADDGEAAIEQFAKWEAQGIKLRTRALVTTMFARLLLADVFIHGIGGAKYDQVTDTICERFFGFRPLTHLTLSGTLRLPVTHESIPPNRGRQLQQTLRELRYHPERYLPWDELAGEDQRQAEQIVAEKKQWVETQKTPENAAERHQRIIAANEALTAWNSAQNQQLESQFDASLKQLRANQVLESREYPFCLFPREQLRNFFLDFSSGMP